MQCLLCFLVKPKLVTATALNTTNVLDFEVFYKICRRFKLAATFKRSALQTYWDGLHGTQTFTQKAAYRLCPLLRRKKSLSLPNDDKQVGDSTKTKPRFCNYNGCCWCRTAELRESNDKGQKTLVLALTPVGDLIRELTKEGYSSSALFNDLGNAIKDVSETQAEQLCLAKDCKNVACPKLHMTDMGALAAEAAGGDDLGQDSLRTSELDDNACGPSLHDLRRETITYLMSHGFLVTVQQATVKLSDVYGELLSRSMLLAGRAVFLGLHQSEDAAKRALAVQLRAQLAETAGTVAPGARTLNGFSREQQRRWS